MLRQILTKKILSLLAKEEISSFELQHFFLLPLKHLEACLAMGNWLGAPTTSPSPHAEEVSQSERYRRMADEEAGKMKRAFEVQRNFFFFAG